MARYIEANDLVRKMTLQANRSALGEIAPPQLSYSEMLEIIADAPTADVVLKSEVSETVEKLMSAIDKVICEAKAEVAREIFEEIESAADYFKELKGFTAMAVSFREYFSKLKKKYTGEQT
jgi:hypothetical protein